MLSNTEDPQNSIVGNNEVIKAEAVVVPWYSTCTDP